MEDQRRDRSRSRERGGDGPQQSSKNIHDDDETKLFVGNISFDITEKELESYFERFGRITSIRIVTDRDTGRPRGFGFITFDTSQAIDDALKEMQGFNLNGRELRVDRTTPKGSGPPAHAPPPRRRENYDNNNYNNRGGRGGYDGDNRGPPMRGNSRDRDRGGYDDRDRGRGGYDNRDRGYDNRNNYNRDQGYDNRDQGRGDSRDRGGRGGGGYNNRDQGYDNRDRGYDNRNNSNRGQGQGGYDNRDQGRGDSRDRGGRGGGGGGYNNRDQGYDNRDRDRDRGGNNGYDNRDRDRDQGNRSRDQGPRDAMNSNGKQKICFNFQKGPGECKFGDNCMYRHDLVNSGSRGGGGSGGDQGNTW